MNRSQRTLRNPYPQLIVVLFLMGFAGWVVGHFISLEKATEERRVPAPHARSKPDGSLSLRLAMIFDVLHQRYVVHSDTWHDERIRHSQHLIDSIDRSASATERLSAEQWMAFNDLAVSCDRLGLFERGLETLALKQVLLEQHFGPSPVTEFDAIGTSNDFLQLHTPIDERDLLTEPLNNLLRLAGDHRQYKPSTERSLSEGEQHWYRLYANRGTLIVHQALYAQNFALLANARDDIARAITINPAAHFGREPWQLQALSLITASGFSAERSLLGSPLRHDLFNPKPVSAREVQQSNWSRQLPDEFNALYFQISRKLFHHPETYFPAAIPQLPIVSADGKHFGMAGVDDMALALIGMWTYGGGPNPHSAMLFGQICERLAQQQLAFFAYQRALGMQEKWPAGIRDDLVSFCQRRQEELVSNPEQHQQWHTLHQQALQYGLAAQKRYTDYETEHLIGGMRFDDAVTSGKRAKNTVYDAWGRRYHSSRSQNRQNDRHYRDKYHGMGRVPNHAARAIRTQSPPCQGVSR